MAEFVKIAAVTTTGSAGSATGDSGVVTSNGAGSSLPTGFLVEIYVDFHASAPSTTDTTISEVLPNGSSLRTILTLTNTNTDGVYAVKIPSYNTTGTASGSDLVYPNIGSSWKVTVAQCDALTAAVTVWAKIVSDV